MHSIYLAIDESINTYEFFHFIVIRCLELCLFSIFVEFFK